MAFQVTVADEMWTIDNEIAHVIARRQRINSVSELEKSVEVEKTLQEIRRKLSERM